MVEVRRANKPIMEPRISHTLGVNFLGFFMSELFVGEAFSAPDSYGGGVMAQSGNLYRRS